MYNFNYGVDSSSIESLLNVSSGFMESFLMIFLTFMIIFMILGLFISILFIVGLWKVFKKADEPGWAAIIPIYNLYIMCKISGVNPWWIVILFASSLIGNISFLGILPAIVSIYFIVLLFVSLANSFGKDIGWVIGLIFLNPFFIFALGVGKSEYLGPKPMNDIIFKKGENVVNTYKAGQQAKNDINTSYDHEVKYCVKCGQQNLNDSEFCTKCGNKF